MQISNNGSGRKSNVWVPLIYCLVLVFGVLLGLLLSSISNGKRAPLLDRAYNKMDDVLSFVKLKYVDTVNTDKLYDVAIQDMLSSLDPHSTYIPKQELAEANESLEGNFEGIGIEFYIVEDTITVVTPISGGPSEMVGIKAGDKIVKINDTIVAGIKIQNEDVLKKLRGAKGTKVKVEILRANKLPLKPFDIIRNKIPLFSVDAGYLIEEKTGYIKINRFSATTYDEFKKKLRPLVDEQHIDKLIVDLRQNPGGYLQTAAQIADELLGGEKIIVYTKGKAYDRQDYLSGRPGLFEKGKLVILIDQGSASASEILAGAIQDWDRGAVVGRTSFGKGLVQEQYDLGDGSGLRLTVARYYTPSGRCIQKPYDKGTSAYYEEVASRFKSGNLFKDDSILKKDSLVFETAKGRKVFGGGGIHPDIFVPLDTSGNLDYYFGFANFIPEFVYKNYSKYGARIDGFKNVAEYDKGFNIDDALYNEFLQYAFAQKIKQDDAKLAVIKPRLVTQLKGYFARQRWQQEGYLYVTRIIDHDLVKALEITKQPNL